MSSSSSDDDWGMFIFGVLLFCWFALLGIGDKIDRLLDHMGVPPKIEAESDP